MARRAIAWLLLAASAGQAILTARFGAALVARTETAAAMLDVTSAEGGFQPRAWRSLCGLDGDVPAGARVLIVTPLPLELGAEYQFLPRPMRALHRIDPAVLASPVAREWFGSMVDDYVAWMDERGRLWTPERLRDGIAWADFVVQVMGGGLTPDVTDALIEVRRQGDATLYRVDRPPGARVDGSGPPR